ncbi:hypothetical protein RWE15_05275 [Virgibacillus halophilus]|uniref:Uncharacterized protein n=1 Tax=Tigheibacillus halophilus TaxID=361280 RepID=A0ABU5C474_9BACI|nr:hypothetical protein [Virgibacillus halophilus]
MDRIDKQAYGKGGVKEYWKWVQQTNW